MASEPDSQKRKRGRPTNASKPPSASQNQQETPEEHEGDAEEGERPKKRGRPRRSVDGPQESSTVPADEPKQKKRGRTGLGAAQEQARDSEIAKKKNKDRRQSNLDSKKQRETQDEQEPVQESEKRGRKKEDAQQVVTEETVSEEAEQPKKKRGRKPTAPQEQPETQPVSRKRGRPSRESNASQENDQEAPVEKQTAKPRKRGRPSLQEVGVEEVQNMVANAKPEKQKKKKNNSAATAEAQDETENQDEEDASRSSETAKGKKKKEKQREQESGNDSSKPQPGHNSSANNADDLNNSNKESTSTHGQKRTSQNSTANAESPFPPPSPEKPYLHLVPRTKQIRPSTISNKWSPLSGASIPAAASLLQLAQRPILARLVSSSSSSNTRRDHAQAALRLIMHRIGKKISKGLPFPPALLVSSAGAGRPRMKVNGLDADGGRETELDFESVLDGKAALERQLEPALHSVELLRREKARMERELERDYETLKKLDSSARVQTRERREQLKKAHILAPNGLAALENIDNSNNSNQETLIVAKEGSGADVFKDIKSDSTLHPLALQLSGHVDSLRNNLDQASGVVHQLGRTRAALRDVLAKHLDTEAYEQVVLG